MTNTTTPAVARAAAILSRRVLVRQDDMLRHLSGPAGHEVGLSARLIDAPMIDMVWDEYGQPYYVHADRLALLLDALPHREQDGMIIFPTNLAQMNSHRI